MKSCGTILFVGAIVLGIGVFASGAEGSSGFITVLVIMAAVGLVIQRASSANAKRSAASAQGQGLTGPRGKAPAASGPKPPQGWDLMVRSDALAREWNNNHPVLPNTGIWNVRTGRAHRRQVFVFQAARVPPASTFMVFRMPNYEGPHFIATSDGRSQITVSGTMPPQLSEMLTRIGPRSFRRLGISPGRLFWADLGSMSADQVTSFVSQKLPGIVQTVNEHLTPAQAPASPPTGAQTARTQSNRAQPAPQGAPRRVVAPPPTMPAARAHRPAPRPNPVGLSSAKLPHDLGPDPDEILQTGPIQLNERPALKPASADPVSRSLENPELAQPWKPVEWSPVPFELSAPMGLGETPTAAEALTSGWKPREWSPPDYGASASGEWKPAATWQPNYSTPTDD